MCNVCGCAGDGAQLENHHHHHHDHHHDHAHHHHHGHGDIHLGHGKAGLAVAGMSQERLIEIETDILAKNNSYADANRRYFGQNGILALNLVSSPGSGKTTLLCKLIASLGAPAAVIEGDQQTTNDADRIRETGVPALQVNTGKGCHLDAHMVGHAVEHLKPQPSSVLFIENVGNLVCPASFDLGEEAKIAVLSVTEGEDKPLKYPDMFAASRLAIVNKVDLAPYCDVDLKLIESNLKRVNPSIEVLFLSAKTGEGLEQFRSWIAGRLLQKQALKAG